MPPFLTARSAAGDQGAHGSEDDGCIEVAGRPLVRAARPMASERAREHLRRRISGPCEGINAAAFPERDLRDNVRRRTEAINAEPPAFSCHFQRTVSDEARAKQGRRLRIAVRVGDREREGRVGDGVIRETAVSLVAGEFGVIAEVFLVMRAKAAVAASVSEPAHADALSHLEARDAVAKAGDFSDNLVTRNDGGAAGRKFAVDDMEVGAANCAGPHFQQKLPRLGDRDLANLQRQRLARRF